MVGLSHWTRLNMEEGKKLLIFASKASKRRWKFVEADNVKCSGLASTRIVRPGVFLRLRQEMISNQAVAVRTVAPRGVDQPFGEKIAHFPIFCLSQLSRLDLLTLVTLQIFESFFLALKAAFFNFSLMPLLAVIDLQKKQQLIRKHLSKHKCNNRTFAEFAVNAQGAYLKWRTYHGARIGSLAGHV